MNNDHCKPADISARCFRRGNNCLYVQKEEKPAENSARPTKKPEYECLNSEKSTNLAEISASPKKNANNYTYALRNQKIGKNFGQKGQKLPIHIVVCNVTQKRACISASFRKTSNTTHKKKWMHQANTSTPISMGVTQCS